MTTDKAPPSTDVVNPHKLVYNRYPNLTNHSYPNDEGVDEGENMSEDKNNPVDGEAQEEAEDCQSDGEEVRRNDESASRPTSSVIIVVNKAASHNKYLVKQVHRHMEYLPREELIRIFKSGNALPEVLRYIQD